MCFWLPMVILSALVVLAGVILAVPVLLAGAMLLYLVVALPAVLLFEIPVWLGFGNIRLGRFGTLTFGSSSRQDQRKALAEFLQDMRFQWEIRRRPEQARQRLEQEMERRNGELQR